MPNCRSTCLRMILSSVALMLAFGAAYPLHAADPLPTSDNNDQLKQFLKLHPNADANHDGVLTVEEAQGFMKADQNTAEGGRSKSTVGKTSSDGASDELPWKEYIRNNEGFEWKLAPGSSRETGFAINMTSQIWHGAPQTHFIRLCVPKKSVAPDVVLIFVAKEAEELDREAEECGIACATVGGIYQGSFGVGGPEQIIFYSIQQYEKTGDLTWVPFPQATKALVRAMDVLETVSEKELGQRFKRFILTGCSKMGMASYLTAVYDARVTGIIPVGGDLFLNNDHSIASMALAGAMKSSGYPMDWSSERMRKMRVMADPLTYRQKLTASVLSVIGTKDSMYALDAANYYWNDLPAQKYHLYLDNSTHGSEEYLNPKATRTRHAFTRALALGKDLPKIESKVQVENIRIRLQATSSIPATSACLWSLGAQQQWSSKPLVSTDNGRTFTGDTDKAQRGQSAVYAELEFELDGLVYSLTTGIEVIKP